MSVREVSFIRHGQTEYNLERRLQGTLPVPLNAQGRAQAAQLARYLAGRHIDALYASPRIRAWDTAQIIGEALEMPIIADERLAEIAFGRFEGHTFAEVATLYPAAYRKWDAGYRSWPVPGGESRIDVQRRMQSAWQDIVCSEDAEVVAIVTHSSAMMILLSAMFAMLPRTGLPNTSITTLRRFDDIWEIAGFGETPHFEA